jgi:CheY-like chemotaxis protein
MSRILVADDNQPLRRVLRMFLEQEGHEVMEACTGTQAIQIAERWRPDLILLDIMMPGMNGFAVCRILKAGPATGTIPVVLITARDRREDVLEAVVAGADDYLLKPFARPVLLAKVRAALAGASALATHRASICGIQRERRRSPRAGVEGRASWTFAPAGGTEIRFHTPVVNLSLWGFACLFDRCATCTGYEERTVHPLCLLAPPTRFDSPMRPPPSSSSTPEPVLPSKRAVGSPTSTSPRTWTVSRSWASHS